jgi:hypothetical protein
MGTAVAKRAATAAKLKPIADVVLKFNIRIWQGNECRLEAAKLLLQLRERIEAGEEGDISWWEWCAANIERGRKDCEALLRLASASDSKKALDEERERVRLSVANHREKKEAEVAAARLLLTANGNEPKPRQLSAAEKEVIARHEEQQVAIKEAWLRDHPERTHHIVKGSDPVSLGLAVVLMMDGEQLRRFCAALEEHAPARQKTSLDVAP